MDGVLLQQLEEVDLGSGGNHNHNNSSSIAAAVVVNSPPPEGVVLVGGDGGEEGEGATVLLAPGLVRVVDEHFSATGGRETAGAAEEVCGFVC